MKTCSSDISGYGAHAGTAGQSRFSDACDVRLDWNEVEYCKRILGMGGVLGWPGRRGFFYDDHVGVNVLSELSLL